MFSCAHSSPIDGDDGGDDDGDGIANASSSIAACFSFRARFWYKINFTLR